MHSAYMIYSIVSYCITESPFSYDLTLSITLWLLNITMENHHLYWECSLLMVIFHGYVKLPEVISCTGYSVLLYPDFPWFSHVLSILKNAIPFPPTAFDEVPGDMVRKPLSIAEKNVRKARKKLHEVKKLEDRLWSVSSPGICFGDR